MRVEQRSSSLLRLQLLMVTTFKTKIDNYDVELEVNIDDEPSTQCFVEHKRYSASLAVLREHGSLISSWGNVEHVVPANIIDVIEEWALARGY